MIFKKKFLVGGFMLVIVAAVGGYHVSVSKSSVDNLLMENVEALTVTSEGGNTVQCYSSSEAKKGATYYDCGPCTKQFNSQGVGPSSNCVYNN